MTQIETSSPERQLPDRVWDWLRIMGPGAIIASVTIGTGELIFSTRGGALFGYRILFLFVIISVLKWALVLSSTRHFVLTGVHPYARMMQLPGPRGWFPVALFLMATFCLPIWISFHSGVIGNLTSWVTGTRDVFNGGMDYLWGIAVLTVILIVSLTGGYSALERIQIAIVTTLIICAGISLLLYNPDWMELLKGAVIPQRLTYPEWLPAKYPDIAKHSVWIETTRYIGVIGGAGFDYMAYASFVREKRWGMTGTGAATDQQLHEIASDPHHPVRRWLRAPLLDLTISFLAVVAFSAVFVASGAIVLGREQIVPDEKNLLNLQSQFVTRIHSWLLPLYVVGALLTMFGTLYGTLEIACSISDEIARCVFKRWNAERALKIRRITITWCTMIAYGILIWLLIRQATYEPTVDAQKVTTARLEKPRILLALLTPVNLFTGVLSCGLFCYLNLWMDLRFLPKGLRSVTLMVANLVAAFVFLALGVKGYWDVENRWIVIVGITSIFLMSLLIAAALSRWHDNENRKNDG